MKGEKVNSSRLGYFDCIKLFFTNCFHPSWVSAFPLPYDRKCKYKIITILSLLVEFIQVKSLSQTKCAAWVSTFCLEIRINKNKWRKKKLNFISFMIQRAFTALMTFMLNNIFLEDSINSRQWLQFSRQLTSHYHIHGSHTFAYIFI